MSSAATGRAREHSVIRHLEKLGYICFRAPASKGIDVFAVHRTGDLPHLACECGGVSKRVAQAYDSLRKHTLPIGTILLLVRRLKTHAPWTWYGDPWTRFSTPLEAIEYARRIAA